MYRPANSPRRQLRRIVDRNESGVALIVAVAVAFVVVLVSVGAIESSTNGVTQSRISETQVQSTDGAEAGISFELANLEEDASSFMCPTVAQATLYGSSAVAYTLSYAIQTGGTAPSSTASPTWSACTPGGSVGLSGDATSYILLQSAGESQYAGFGAKTVEALLTVTPSSSTTLSDALYGGTGVYVQNGATLTTGSGVANVYAGTGANGLPCSSSGGPISTTGSVYSLSTSTWNISNGCTVKGDVWGAGPITISSSSPVLSGTVETPSTITVNNPPNTEFNNAEAGGTITVPVGGEATTDPSTCAPSSQPVFKTCTPHDTAVTAPPSEEFPSITASNFAGYTVEDPSCADATSAITTYAEEGTGSYLVELPSTCAWDPSNVSLSVGNNIAVFSPDGIAASNGFTLADTGGTHSVYFVVPSGDSGSISFADSPSFSSSLDVLLYTPNNVTFTNGANSAIDGEVYAGGAVYVGGSNISLQFEQVALSGASSSSGGGSEVVRTWEY